MSLHGWVAVIAASVCLLSSCSSGNDAPDVNDPPVIGPQDFSGMEDAVLEGRVVATDPGDSLTFTAQGNPSHGTLESFDTNGNFRYRPNANFNGADTFTVRVVDSGGANASTTVQLTLSPVNDAPLASDDVFTVADANSLAVLTNDLDIDNDALTLEIVGAPFAGTASVTNDNRIAVSLPAGFKGLTKLRYRIRDAGGLSSEANALVFVGIDPFKVIYLGSEGIFVNDLLSTNRVSASEATPTTQIESMQAAKSGRAVVYLIGVGSSQQLMYVDLSNPGTARVVGPPVPKQGPEGIRNYQITADGRYVTYELVKVVLGYPESSTMKFDAQGSGDPVMLGAPVSSAGQGTSARNTGAYSRLSASGSRLYHLSRVPGGSPQSHAYYRSDLATGDMTRVTPVNTNYQSAGGAWIADNESSLTMILRRPQAGVYLDSDAYLVDPAQPDSQVRLSSGFGGEKVGEPPVLSPDGSHLFYSETTTMGTRLGTLRIVQTAPPRISSPIGTEDSGPGDYRQDAEVDGLDAGHMMRRDSRAMLLASKSNLYEVLFEDTLNPILVNVASAGERLTDGRYSLDGERIFHVRRETAGTSRILEMTRRSALGTGVPLTSSAEHLRSYLLDAQGRVALFMRDDNLESPFALVNSDVPRVYLPLTGPGASATSAVALVTR